MTAPAPEISETTQYLEQLVRAMEESGGEPGAQRELIDHAHETIHELAQSWRDSDSLPQGQDTDALINLLVSTRTRLRAAKQFALADQVRDALTSLGIVLEDTCSGTLWKKEQKK